MHRFLKIFRTLRPLLPAIMAVELLFFFPAQQVLADLPTKPVNNTPANNTATNTPSASSAVQATNTPIVAYNGPEASIKRLLCTPGQSDYGAPTNDQTQGKIGGVNVPGTQTATNNPAAGDLATCINRIYRFSAALGSFAAVFFIALAGYYYILGGEHAKEKAKHIIISVIVGLLIIFTSYILLKFINPESVKFKTIQPPQLGNYAELPSCADLGLPGQECLLNGSIAVSTGNGAGSNYDIKECPTGIKPIPADIAGKSGELGCQTLIDALAMLKQQNVPFTVHDAFGSGHQSLCHTQGGTCADITPNKNSYAELCVAVKATGKFRILNESRISSTECGPFVQTKLSTGAHLHIILQAAKDDLGG